MTMPPPIPFNRPWISGKELDNIRDAHTRMHLSGDGHYSRLCHQWLEEQTGAKRALLTHSCTAALEMAALLLDLVPGDEVIMPSWTFVSTANAVVLRGAIPVFVDVRGDTLNIDERLIEAAITTRTRAIVVVHYAGVGAEMVTILELAARHGITVIEDAAQGLMSTYRGQALGSIGQLGAFSFHETKNVIAGEGGALLVNSGEQVLRAEILREKGTDRSRFFRGEVDKYTWQDMGSSYLPGEMVAAFLFAQLEHAEWVTSERLKAWSYYHKALNELEADGILRRPVIPDECQHNAHLYYVLLNKRLRRETVLDAFRQARVGAVFHYVPLHTAPAGLRYGRVAGELPVTDFAANQLIRLPLWVELTQQEQDRVVEVLLSFR